MEIVSWSGVSLWRERGIIDAEFLKTIAQYCLDYEEGKLDYAEYERFLMKPMSFYSAGQAEELIQGFLQELRLLFRPYMLQRLEESTGQRGIL